MADLSSAVVAHQRRLVAATDLARRVDGLIVLDPGDTGADANHLRAWELTETLDSEFALVLEDDAVPVEGFLDQAQEALHVAPADVVSFYLGTSRPRRWQERIPSALAIADRAGACWLTTTSTIHAVAIAIRSSLREDWLEYAHTSTLPIDERMSAWCISRGHEVAYTWPSLVDHADWPTLIRHADGKPRTEPRRAWRTGVRDAWTSKAVKL